MKKFLISAVALVSACLSLQAKNLVTDFSAEGHTNAVAERIAELLDADLYRIEAADPYAENPYDDSERIQNEAYNDLRPAVANPPSQEWTDQYDRIFIGSPCWWHQPAMVVCTFLENYDLSKQVIVPFITYGATTYLNETMQKIYKCTPNSVHIPETLPENLDADDIKHPGRPDDANIAMPGNEHGVERWLETLGISRSGVGSISTETAEPVSLKRDNNSLHITVADGLLPNTVEIYNMQGALLQRMAD